MDYLLNQGIQTSVHYPPVHLFAYYRSTMRQDAELPLTEYVGQREVTLPLFPAMDEQQIDYVVDCMMDFIK